jgi:hypothetical protein
MLAISPPLVTAGVAFRMWSKLDRTRRRLRRASAKPAPGAAPTGDPSAIAATAPGMNVVIAIGRPEFDRLGAALQTVLGPTTTRLDTPDRLEAALAVAIVGLGATGETRVERRPAGLYTPEAWQVRLTGAEPAIEIAIRRAIREGVFAA